MYSIFDRIKAFIAAIFRSRVFIVIVSFCALFSILIVRLFNLQIVNGQQYLDDYKLQIQKTRVLQGTRGNIYDRNGNLLAYNDLAYSVTIEDTGSYNSIKEKNEQLNSEISQIIQIVEKNGDSIINDFNVIIENDEYHYSMTNETLKLRFLADVYGLKTIDKLSEKQKSQSAAELIHYLCTDEEYGYGLDEKKLSKEEVLKLVTVRYAMGLKSFQKYIPTTIAADISDETMAAVMERLDEFPGVNIAEESMRRYTDSKYFANIIGYTGNISQDEYDALSEDDQERYSLTDTVGKAGLEQVMDTYLQGEKGEEKLYVNSVGKVIESSFVKKPSAGNDLYLTIDADLQKVAYDALEQELAGILLAKMADLLDYDRSQTTDAGDVIVASGDMYYSFIGNDIIDMDHFGKEEAGQAEKSVAGNFANYKASVLEQIKNTMLDANSAAYTNLPREQQAYQSYIVNDLLTTTHSVLLSGEIDRSDDTYLKWKEEETINIHQYLNYAISKNWIDSSKLQQFLGEKTAYSDAKEIYDALVAFVIDRLSNDSAFDKLIYRYMIKAGSVSGREIAMILYEQGVLAYDEAQYNALANASLGAYDFIRGKIETLDITPGQLGLEPCTGSVVITDPNNGNVLACVSYPGYDNNRLANSMDSTYYNQLVTVSSRPFYNNATQEKTAPGSTFKPLAAITGLMEGAVSADTYIDCEGVYTGVEPNVNCWVYPDSHGGLDVVGAITHSCNVYFCSLGFNLGVQESEEVDEDGNHKRTYSSELGLEKLRSYATAFGLSEKSGLEIPETDPQISNEDSVRSSMGQGTNNYTTSQLAKYVSAIANRGSVYDLTLLDRIEDTDGTVIKEFDAELKNTVDNIPSNVWDLVHAGMRGVVENNSTVFGKLNNSGVVLSGKTGTAQQSKTHPDHGLFVGFAPYNNPEVAMAIRIANGYSSTFAAEVGNVVMEYYYGVTDRSELITGTAKTVTVSHHAD